jgi:glucokinase
MYLIAGDVGGTKTRLSVYEKGSDEKLKRLIVKLYPSKEFSKLEDIVAKFVEESGYSGKFASGALGVPGPVVAGAFKATNLPWEVIHQDQISSRCELPQFYLYNDLSATISAVPHFSESDLVVIHPGEEHREKKVFAMLAPGTGLGQGFMIQLDDGRYIPFPSEGGHVEFAPKNELEFDLLKYLQRKLKKRISIERVLCGPGLLNIYAFLKDHGYSDEPSELRDELEVNDAAAVIANAGIEGKHEICVKALDIFATLLGSQAGDTVLTYLALGGMYLGGGIPPKILPKLLERGVREAYLKKGRMSPLVEATPLFVVKDDHAALLGAASLAAKYV